MPTPTPDPVDTTRVKSEVELWKTQPDGLLVLAKDPTAYKWKTIQGNGVVITVDSTQRRQTMDGFGAAVTGSSAHVIMQLTEASRKALIKDLFKPDSGIGISFVRITIGASDFSINSYTYLDTEDTTLQAFSLDVDEQELVPVLQQILLVHPGLKIMATPWSPPAWMKDNRSLNGGSLLPKYYGLYARYLVKYVKTMESLGIPIYAISPQNEPEHTTNSYPSMGMTAQQQLVFIRDYLGPEFAQAGIASKIFVFDHNWDNVQYPQSIYNDPIAKDYVAGAAYHCYGGNVSAMSVVHNAFPDKDLWFTECSGGDWATNFGDNLKWNSTNLMIGAPLNWAKGILFWNIALDQNDGPQNGGCTNCRGVVTVAANTYQRNVEYYLLAHSSKFVPDGSVRIASSSTNSQVGNVAYRRPDGRFVLVCMNYSDSPQEISVKVGEIYLNWTLPAGTLATLAWPLK